MRTFETGATRDTDINKLDFEGFLSHPVLVRYAEYMNKNRIQADGNVRDSDNWQKGIPKDAYMKSMWRHFMDVWGNHRGSYTEYGQQEALCALLFNVMGYLHEELKNTEYKVFFNKDGDELKYAENVCLVSDSSSRLIHPYRDTTNEC